MKKMFLELILVVFVMLFAACGSNADNEATTSENNQILPTESIAIIDVPECADDKFLANMKKSVLRRMKDNSAGEVDRLTLVTMELELLAQFEYENFNDSRLSDLAKQYINGLKIQKEALQEEKRSDDQVKWQEGYVERCSALKSLYEEFSFMADHPQFATIYIASYDDEVELRNTFCAVEADLSTQLASPAFRMSKKGYFLSFELENNTEYTFSTAFEMLYQYETSLPAESTTTYIENIKPGEKYTVSLYCSRLDAVVYTEFDNYYLDAQTRY